MLPLRAHAMTPSVRAHHIRITKRAAVLEWVAVHEQSHIHDRGDIIHIFYIYQVVLCTFELASVCSILFNEFNYLSLGVPHFYNNNLGHVVIHGRLMLSGFHWVV